MNFAESFRIALSGLASNRLRAVLTTLGIMIGVGAVISLISLGRGVENFIASEFESLGANILFVTSASPESATRDRIEPLTTLEAQRLTQPGVAPSIAQVALSYGVQASVSAGQESGTYGVSGVTPNFTEVRVWYPRSGQFITQDDVDDASRVAVLGVQVVEDLWGDKEYDPTGQTIRINDFVFTIVGIMEEQGSALSNEDNSIFIPISTAQTRLSRARTRDGGYRVNVLFVEAVSKETMDSAVQEIDAFFSEAHNIVFDGDQDFQIINQADLLASLGAVTGLITVFLGIIASISLVVGGIGIMNIMLVSVTERTREIGLRKAVGARGQDILSQFLIESVVLSFIGGAIGIAIGWALVPSLALALTADAIALATIVSSFVGIFFGLWPASRAARMRPIDALRYE
jgi:putative ABC transport system permease protein